MDGTTVFSGTTVFRGSNNPNVPPICGQPNHPFNLDFNTSRESNK